MEFLYLSCAHHRVRKLSLFVRRDQSRHHLSLCLFLSLAPKCYTDHCKLPYTANILSDGHQLRKVISNFSFLLISYKLSKLYFIYCIPHISPYFSWMVSSPKWKRGCSIWLDIVYCLKLQPCQDKHQKPLLIRRQKDMFWCNFKCNRSGINGVFPTHILTYTCLSCAIWWVFAFLSWKVKESAPQFFLLYFVVLVLAIGMTVVLSRKSGSVLAKELPLPLVPFYTNIIV